MVIKKIEDCKGKFKEVFSDEEILILAENLLCPHYIVINPLTQKKTILFDNSELNEWFRKDCVKAVEAHKSSNKPYSFFVFDKREHSAKGTNIPDELSAIKELYELPIANISTPSGIYFLCKDKKIQYVGQSVNIAHRVLTHLIEGIKEFDSVFFVICPVNKLTEMESELIKHFKPSLNKNGISKKDLLKEYNENALNNIIAKYNLIPIRPN